MTRDPIAQYGRSASSPVRASDIDTMRQPRHCGACGRGLSQARRSNLSPEDRLLRAIFGYGPICQPCVDGGTR